MAGKDQKILVVFAELSKGGEQLTLASSVEITATVGVGEKCVSREEKLVVAEVTDTAKGMSRSVDHTDLFVAKR